MTSNNNDLSWLQFLLLAVALLSIILGIEVIDVLEQSGRDLGHADALNHIQAEAVIELRRELDEAQMKLKAVEDARYREQTELNHLRQRAAQEGW